MILYRLRIVGLSGLLGVLPPCQALPPSISPASAFGLRAEYLQPASSRNRWQSQLSGPSALFRPTWTPSAYHPTIFPNPKTTTMADYFLQLLPAPIIIWRSSSANRPYNARRTWPRPKRQYTTTEPVPPLASNGGDGYDLNDELLPNSCPF
jgi:hypothetical protein